MVPFSILVRQVYSAIVISSIDNSSGIEYNWGLSIVTTAFITLVLLGYSTIYLELYVCLVHCD